MEILWKVERWPMTVADIVAVEPNAEAYAAQVSRWARSVVETLDGSAADQR